MRGEGSDVKVKKWKITTINTKELKTVVQILFVEKGGEGK